MIKALKNFIVDHYLSVTYSVTALALVLAIVFNENLEFLFHILICLVVIGLYTAIGFLGYMVIKAIFADHLIDKKSIKIIILLLAILIGLYPAITYALDHYSTIEHGLTSHNLGKLYLLAPIASWPAIIAILILNIKTKWGNHREKKKLKKLQNECQE